MTRYLAQVLANPVSSSSASPVSARADIRNGRCHNLSIHTFTTSH